jgi:hypothetical protein
LRSRAHFRRYRGRPLPFSCFVLLDLFSVVPRVQGPDLMFCASVTVFDDTKGVASGFHVCTPGLVFDGTEGFCSRFHVLCSQTCFWRCGGRRHRFSCFALPEYFSAEPRASASVFMFCAPELVFSGTSEKVFGSAKHENETRRLSVPPKMSLGAQNMKTGPDALCTAENESRSVKHENRTRRPRYRRK